MGGEDDGKVAQAQGDEAAAQQAQVTGGAGSDDADKARAGYEAALRERDERMDWLHQIGRSEEGHEGRGT